MGFTVILWISIIFINTIQPHLGTAMSTAMTMMNFTIVIELEFIINEEFDKDLSNSSSDRFKEYKNLTFHKLSQSFLMQELNLLFVESISFRSGSIIIESKLQLGSNAPVSNSEVKNKTESALNQAYGGQLIGSNVDVLSNGVQPQLGTAISTAMTNSASTAPKAMAFKMVIQLEYTINEEFDKDLSNSSSDRFKQYKNLTFHKLSQSFLMQELTLLFVESISFRSGSTIIGSKQQLGSNAPVSNSEVKSKIKSAVTEAYGGQLSVIKVKLFSNDGARAGISVWLLFLIVVASYNILSIVILVIIFVIVRHKRNKKTVSDTSNNNRQNTENLKPDSSAEQVTG